MEKETVLMIIRQGSSLNPMSATEIGRHIHKSGSDIRNYISELRAEGNLICANNDGYWMAESQTQAQRWLDSHEKRLRAMFRARSGFKRGLQRHVWRLTQAEIFR